VAERPAEPLRFAGPSDEVRRGRALPVSRARPSSSRRADWDGPLRPGELPPLPRPLPTTSSLLTGRHPGHAQCSFSAVFIQPCTCLTPLPPAERPGQPGSQPSQGIRHSGRPAGQHRRQRRTPNSAEGRYLRGSGPQRKNVRRRPTLPRSPPRSTIGAEGLNFRVRNGTGCFPFAMATETLWRCARPTASREPHSGRKQ
jgi:hypothetical protein